MDSSLYVAAQVVNQFAESGSTDERVVADDDVIDGRKKVTEVFAFFKGGQFTGALIFGNKRTLAADVRVEDDGIFVKVGALTRQGVMYSASKGGSGFGNGDYVDVIQAFVAHSF